MSQAVRSTKRGQSPEYYGNHKEIYELFLGKFAPPFYMSGHVGQDVMLGEII